MELFLFLVVIFLFSACMKKQERMISKSWEFEKNEKSTRYDAFNALKKTRLINLNPHNEYAHLFNS